MSLPDIKIEVTNINTVVPSDHPLFNFYNQISNPLTSAVLDQSMEWFIDFWQNRENDRAHEIASKVSSRLKEEYPNAEELIREWDNLAEISVTLHNNGRNHSMNKST